MRAEGAAQEAAGKAQGFYGDVKDRASHALDEASDAAHDVLEHGGEYARQGVRAVGRSVEGYPLAYPGARPARSASSPPCFSTNAAADARRLETLQCRTSFRTRATPVARLLPTPPDFADGEVGSFRRLSWPAVFAGSLTGLVAQIVLSLLGLGVGLSAAPGVKSFSARCGHLARALGDRGLCHRRLHRRPRQRRDRSLGGRISGLGDVGADDRRRPFHADERRRIDRRWHRWVPSSGALGGAGSAVSSAVETAAPTLKGSIDPTASILGPAEGCRQRSDERGRRQ